MFRSSSAARTARRRLQNCTLISAPYRIGDSSAVGTLSVLGPTRIEYARMISIVCYVARTLEKMMSRDVAKTLTR